MDTSLISVKQLRARIEGPDEIAVIDVREQGVFYHGHLYSACCIPLSQLEILIGRLVPRQTTPIVVHDGGGDSRLARIAMDRLGRMRYTHVSILEGGIVAWKDAGHELFSGVNVPSKAFGEMVEQACRTPHISAQELHQRLETKDNIVVLDSRPYGEYTKTSIPTGINVPGAELVHRVFDLVKDPATTVVVNCAGRTRSIIGAQSLINAGLENPVMALKDGTMGWFLAGFEPDHGKTQIGDKPAKNGLVQAQQAAADVAARFDVKTVDHDQVLEWQHQTKERTLFLLDVRTEEEYLRGHFPGAQWAPGGQLVQATDEYMAVHNARVVLIDDISVRAIMTASWLQQMGWREVYVLENGLSDLDLESGPYRGGNRISAVNQFVSAEQLHKTLDSKEPVVVLDLSSSKFYREKHIPGAFWGVRSRLESSFSKLPETDVLVLTAENVELAQLAAMDLQQLEKDLSIFVLEGGFQAWEEAGYPLASGLERPICDADDVWYKPYELDHTEDISQHMQDYLDWEVDLVGQLKRDGVRPFDIVSPGS
ncbi:rhodanese-like domain-containing protein [Pseudomonadota bacterium]